jgi:protein Hikeshi
MGDINLGISVEPAANIQAQLAALQSQSQTHLQSPTFPGTASSSAMVLHRPPPQTKVLAQRIIKDAFNFLASFAGGGGAGTGGQEVVPLKSFQDWWTKFERRLENDPSFLEREEGN